MTDNRNHFDLPENDLPSAEWLNVRLLTARQVAAICGTSISTVYRHVDQGVLPQPIRLGGASRWRAGDIRKAIHGHQRPAA